MKKILCACLGSIVMMMAILCPTYAQTEESDSMTLLQALDIMKGYEDGQLHPEYSITRMEFAAMMVRALGFEAISYGTGASAFSDVSSDSWGVGYVNLVKELGLMQGYDNGDFGPEDLITVLDTATALTRAMGYHIEADEKGGYPSGYLTTANRLGIIDGIETYDAPATRGEVARMIFNSLEVEFLTGNLSENDPSYRKSNYTMLKALDVTKIRDTVTAMYGLSMDKDSEALNRGEAKIGNKVYRIRAGVDNACVGVESDIYIRYAEDSAKTVIAAVLPRYTDNRMRIDAKDIDDKTTLDTLYYWQGAKLKKVALSDQLTVSYNGGVLQTTASLTDSRLKPKTGSVTLLDGDGDGKYERAVVWNYETYVVSGVREDAIYDSFGHNFTYDPNQTEITVRKGEDFAEMEDVQIGHVLNAAVSLDGSKAEIVISDFAAEGTISKVYEEEGKTYYALETGDAYTTTPSYQIASDEGYAHAPKLELGDTYVLHLNAFGEIAYATETAKGGGETRYGWLNEITQAGKEYYMALMTQDNTYEGYMIKDSKVLFGRLSGGAYVIGRVKAEDIAKEIGTYKNTALQMIEYALDEDGCITEVYLAGNANAEEFSKDVDKSGMNFAYHTIDNRYYYDDKTAVFHIPSAGVYPERISAGKPSDYFANNRSYRVELYDVDPLTHYVKLIVYTASITDYNDVYIHYVNSPVMLVTDISEELDEEGNACTYLEGYEEGKLIRRLVSDRVDIAKMRSEIRTGTLIQYEVSSELAGYAQTSDEKVGMVLYNVLFQCDERDADTFTQWNYEEVEAKNAKIKVAYTKVRRYEYPILTTEETNGSVYEINDGTVCYRYRAQGENPIEKIDAAEIMQGDHVVIRTRYNYTKEIIVVE